MTGVDPSELLELACRLAVRAGDRVEEWRTDVLGRAGALETKSSGTDLVTEADRAAEAIIVDGLGEARPEDGLLGEEGAAKPGTSGVRWIFDPIDGTTNYVYGIPAYSVSIAAEVAGVVVAGAVYDPAGEILYAAASNRGATRNGDPISCSSRDELPTALVATGFGYVASRRLGQAEVLADLLPRVRDIRRFGSAALDLCAVACGRVDAYYEKGLNPWDLAAGQLIAREAGATVGNLRGGEPDSAFTLAAPAVLFGLLRDVLIASSADFRP